MEKRVISFLLYSCLIAGFLVFPALAQTQPISGPYPRNLTIGDQGNDVSLLQEFLITNGYLHIPARTGYFGDLTSAAIAVWQGTVGLPQTGFFGPLSRAAIAGNTRTNISLPPAPVPASPSTYDRNLTIGDIGTDVSSLQSLLIAKGFLDIPDPTGDFGPLTSAALAGWQASEGLPATGYFGTLSRAAVAASPEIVSAPTPTTSAAPAPVSAPAPFTTLPALPYPTSSLGKLITNIVTDVVGGGGGGGGGGSGGGSPPPPSPAPAPADTTPPTISITSPASSSTASGKITITVNAADDVGVTKVELYADGNLKNSTTTPPYTFLFDTTTLTNGSHTLVTKAYDAAGNVGTSGNTLITVNNLDVTAPTVPTGLIVTTSTTSTISLSWTAATDNVGVAGYKIFRSGTPIATTTATTSYQNTGLSASTPYSYTVSAFDAAGNVSVQSASASTTTLAAGPSVPQTLAITAITTSSISLSWAASTEFGGTIAGYKLYRGGAQIAIATTTSYVDAGLTASTTYSYNVASYDGGGLTSATSTSVTNTTQAIAASSFFQYDIGLSVGTSMLGLNSTAQNLELNTMVSLGISWLRFDIQWDDVQWQNSANFDWSDIDPLVAAAAAHHIKILAILDYTPAWAASSSCPGGSNLCAPGDPTLFAAFAKKVVQRYSPEGISDWEIWNEPNNAFFWGPKVDCNAYTVLLKDTYTAIKQADPNATVITGGLAPESTDGSNMSPTDFLTCIYNNGGENYFDAVADHPYTFPGLPTADTQGAWAQMSITTPSLRSIMTANGDSGKKIWVTEFGVPTNGPDPNWYVSEAVQSAMVTSSLQLYTTYSWIGPFFWYTLEDGGNATNTNENFFGLIRYDGSTKPAYTTLKNLISP